MRTNDDEHFGVKQTQYTIEQAIEDDEIFRQIKAGKSPYTDVEEIKKMVAELTTTILNVNADTSFIKDRYTKPKEKRVSKVKESKIEKKANLRHRILNPRG